ncbi:DUF6230 family protein [Lipingzhangella sp. LS1_29]|uniref:DUF6230 family protein n=1 Tax=Lipingzhangella rawalii TaxID=2055835 RepID=A0ABU2HBD1_9ACTN|nr:DUF6230 family protein [Lipingzhangella rawalii]MDS1272568.1 DUF6230 family protein [Lipingzhangella rawalii]
MSPSDLTGSTSPTAAATAAAPTAGTRWSKFAMLAVPGFLAAGVMGLMTTQGLLAASFAVSGDNFQLTADQLDGQGFAQYGDVATSADDSSRPVGLAHVDSAELDNMCLSAQWDLAIGDASLIITAGENEPVQGSSLTLDMEEMSGDADFSNIQIGRDASTLDKADGAQGPVGNFGLQSDTIVVDNLNVSTWSVTSGSLNLTGLNMSIRPGVHECD